MPEPIAVGLVGCGFFAQNHLHPLNDLRSQRVEIVAVCDIDPAKAKAAAWGFGVPHWCTDAETMFREQKLGLVDIATRLGAPSRGPRRTAQ